MKAVIATSLVPRNIELQRKTTDSWRNLGFSVISLNCPWEVALLRGNFPNCQFVNVFRTANKLTGKPLVYFDDILKALDDSGADVLGIVNSDIFLRAGGNEFLKFVAEQTRGSFLFGPRVEVTSYEDLEGSKYPHGFDFFFFDRNVLRSYPKSEFCFGLPWWDYWAPLVPMLNNIQVKELMDSPALHITHPERWDVRHYVRLAQTLRNLLSRIGNSSKDHTLFLKNVSKVGFPPEGAGMFLWLEWLSGVRWNSLLGRAVSNDLGTLICSYLHSEVSQVYFNNPSSEIREQVTRDTLRYRTDYDVQLVELQKQELQWKGGVFSFDRAFKNSYRQLQRALHKKFFDNLRNIVKGLGF